MLTQHTQNFHLNPALIPFGSSSDLNLEPGSYLCTIRAEHGDLIFHHLAYDIYNGTWTNVSASHEPESVIIHEGETKDFQFTCSTSGGYPDDISIVNNSYFKPADFTCTCIAQ